MPEYNHLVRDQINLPKEKHAEITEIIDRPFDDAVVV